MLTKSAIREMIIPSLLPVLAPIVVYFILLRSKCSINNSWSMLLGTIVTGLW